MPCRLWRRGLSTLFFLSEPFAPDPRLQISFVLSSVRLKPALFESSGVQAFQNIGMIQG